MSENTKWGMDLISRIGEAKEAMLFWGARANASPEHRDFEIDIDAQGFYIIDDASPLPEERKLIIIRALSVALESGGIIKRMKDKVHNFRYGRLIPKRNRPPKAFKHAMKLVDEGKIDRSTAVRLWVDEEKPTMISGGRKIHEIYEDESCLAYGDTMGSDDKVHILFFIRHTPVRDARFGLGEVALHDMGRVIILGHVAEGEQIWYNVFVANASAAGGRRIIRVLEDSLEPQQAMGAEET